MNTLDTAWADVYWTFPDNAFDYSDIHIAISTVPVPFSNTKYFSNHVEVPF